MAFVAQSVQTVIVAAGVLIEGGRVLVSQRKKGAHLAGAWELPGGKVEEGEDPAAAVVRELREELGVEVRVDDILDVTFHRYPARDGHGERSVLLLFYRCTRLPGSPEPQCLDVAALAWEDAAGLIDERFPEADRPVLEKLRRLLAEASV